MWWQVSALTGPNDENVLVDETYSFAQQEHGLGGVGMDMCNIPDDVNEFAQHEHNWPS